MLFRQSQTEHGFGVTDSSIVHLCKRFLEGNPVNLNQLMTLRLRGYPGEFPGKKQMNDFVAKSRCNQDVPQFLPAFCCQTGFLGQLT